MNEQKSNNKSEQTVTDTGLNETNNTSTLVGPTKNHKFKVLEFIKIMGNHNEKNRMFIPEYMNQSKVFYYTLSSGTNNEIKIYNTYFIEEKGMIKEEVKDWIYNMYERDNNKNNESEFIVCAFREISLLKFKDKKYEENNNKKWNVPNMTCLSCAEVKIKKQKENEDHITEYLIIAGRNGIKYITDVFRDKNKNDLNSDLNNSYIDRKNTFRSVFNLGKTRIVCTSNSIIPDGKNKLIIYNFNKNSDNSKRKEENENEYEIEEIEKENYSFIASNNGIACYDDNILLCACKKYTKKDQNGILLLIIKYDNNKDKESKDKKIIEVKKKFCDTKDFEVYCFCHKLKRKQSGSQNNINEKTDPFIKTDFFFVGGFDKKLREGKIKLYKYERKNKEIIGIKFLQDIEFDEKYEELSIIEMKIRKPEKFEGFSGAINSIIQDYCSSSIIVSCYNGKIYQLSEPNLQSYEDSKKK